MPNVRKLRPPTLNPLLAGLVPSQQILTTARASATMLISLASQKDAMTLENSSTIVGWSVTTCIAHCVSCRLKAVQDRSPSPCDAHRTLPRLLAAGSQQCACRHPENEHDKCAQQASDARSWVWLPPSLWRPGMEGLGFKALRGHRQQRASKGLCWGWN